MRRAGVGANGTPADNAASEGGAGGGNGRGSNSDSKDGGGMDGKMDGASQHLPAEFQPSDRFRGRVEGFVFKMGPRGLGYYEDVGLGELER